jgi:hypothetical protein
MAKVQARWHRSGSTGMRRAFALSGCTDDKCQIAQPATVHDALGARSNNSCVSSQAVRQSSDTDRMQIEETQ